jgi:hypothetical protein
MPEKGNSPPGNANLRIGTQASSGKDSHSNLYRKYVLRHTSSISPTEDTVMSPFRRYVLTRRHSCFLPSYLPPPGVIAAFSRHTCLPPASFLRRQES